MKMTDPQVQFWKRYYDPWWLLLNLNKRMPLRSAMALVWILEEQHHESRNRDLEDKEPKRPGKDWFRHSKFPIQNPIPTIKRLRGRGLIRVKDMDRPRYRRIKVDLDRIILLALGDANG